MLSAMVKLVRDPSRLDEVFTILDGIEQGPEADAFVAQFVSDTRNAEAFVLRPRVGKLELETLLKLPEGTLGRTFAEEMRSRNLDPADIQMRERVVTDAEYIYQHLRETHDIWHTATGFEVDVAGELGLQAFYAAQFRAPLAVLIIAIGLLNSFFFSMDDAPQRLAAVTRGYSMGRAARTFFGFDWAAHWSTPLAEVRARLGVAEPASVALTPHAADSGIRAAA